MEIGENLHPFPLRKNIRLKLDILELSSERGVLQWHSCPGSDGVTIRGGVQSCGEVALRDVVSEHGGDGLIVGLGDLSSLFQL